jgi:hypothetical protein
MREARLKPEFRERYPGIPAEVWMPVGVLLDRLTAQLLLERASPGAVLRSRIIDETHFEFRGSSPRPEGKPEDRSRATD